MLLLAVMPAAFATPAASGQTESDHNRSWAVLAGTAREIRFQELTRADGLAQEYIYQFLPDHRGFLWFTLYGSLARFDGYRTVRYAGIPMITARETPILQSGNAHPGLLYQDHKGSLWVATDALSRFDETTGRFIPVVRPRSGPPQPDTDLITAIHDGPGDSLWVGISSFRSSPVLEDISEPVLYQIDPGKGAVVRHRIPESITQGRPAGIRAIESDSAGRLWLGTSIGLVRFDPASGVFQYYAHSHPDPDARISRTFNGLAWDKTGHLWIHMPAGLERFEPATGVFDRFTAVKFWEMRQDKTGRLWLTSGRDAGVKVFDPSNPPETALRRVAYLPPGNPDEERTIQTLGMDLQGSVYLRHRYKIFRHSVIAGNFGLYASEKSNPDSLSGGSVRGLAEEGDGSIWFADMSAGLNLLDIGSGKFKHFRHEAGNPQGPPSDAIFAIYRDRGGTLWLQSGDQVGRFDRRTARFSSISGSNPIAFQAISFQPPTARMEGCSNTGRARTRSSISSITSCGSRNIGTRYCEASCRACARSAAADLPGARSGDRAGCGVAGPHSHAGLV